MTVLNWQPKKLRIQAHIPNELLADTIRVEGQRVEHIFWDAATEKVANDFLAEKALDENSPL